MHNGVSVVVMIDTHGHVARSRLRTLLVLVAGLHLEDVVTSDALQGKIGRKPLPYSQGYEFFEAIGPVGATHYLIRRIGPVPSAKVVPISDLEDLNFFANEADARSAPSSEE